MDTSTISPVERKQIYELLCTDLIRGLEKGDMNTTDSEESCVFIVEELEKAQTKHDVLLFLQALATRWPSYQTAYLAIRGQVLQIEDQRKAKDVAKEIQKIFKTL